VAAILDIADALVEVLNRLPWSQPLAAARYYRPRYELADLADLKASVETGTAALERTSRAGPAQGTYTLLVAFYRRVQLDDESPVVMRNPDLDALVGLVDEVAAYFLGHPRPLQPYHPAHCVAVAVDPVFSADELDTQGVFASALTLTFRDWPS
jgi:hypothetical protein